jgi:hypothetical protein
MLGNGVDRPIVVKPCASSLGVLLLVCGLIGLVAQARVYRVLSKDIHEQVLAKSVKFCEFKIADAGNVAIAEESERPSPLFFCMHRIPALPVVTPAPRFVVGQHRIRPPPEI